jgi:hypothetical protein
MDHGEGNVVRGTLPKRFNSPVRFREAKREWSDTGVALLVLVILSNASNYKMFQF